MLKAQNGSKVEVNYIGTFEDGTKFDSSYDRGETLSFELGAGQMISGFDDAVAGMSVGDSKDVTLEPQDAYGPHDPEAVVFYPRHMFPEEVQLSPGVTISGQSEEGYPLLAKVVSIEEERVELDFNHPLAGKTLNFKIDLVNLT